MTREVPVTRVVERVRDVLVEIAVTRQVEITREVPVTRLVAATPQGSDQPIDQPDGVPLRILAINDFHGNIATSSSSFGGVGRVDYLAANLAAAAEGAENSVFVSAGDLIGASPLISALFHDEPTIEAMNLMGLDINSVGNHEFDEGMAELLRMQHGGPHPVDGDLDGDPFAGADFQFLAANVIDDATGKTLFPPYAIRDYRGVKVAFIGLTLEGTPSIVARSGVAGVTFQDEAETVNSLVPQLREEGIEAIVVLLHEGGFSDGGQNDCGSGLTGPIAGITARLDAAVDLVIAGHTNDEFICEIDGKWVTMADNGGRLFTVIDATLDRTTRDLVVQSINNVPNSTAGVTPDPALTALIDRYAMLSGPLANAVIGMTTTDISRDANAAGESALGDVIADAQLAATRSADTGNAVVSFMNSGGIRNDITFAASGGEADGEFTFGEGFSVHPFGNSLVTMSLTGAQIHTLLEAQFDNPEPGSSRILQVSAGFSYTWDAAQPTGSKVDPTSITIDGRVVDPDTSYRVTVNSYMAEGGDRYSILADGTERLGGVLDLDALIAYFANTEAVAPGPQDRITRLN
ncbi:MAG: bifunctional metallophosphatase/5'-nucleotidase [Chloroflexi bacterium]|nr:bifunctional metallophosphatase/5'-nucleotidase [Chloroflexota bacterium]